MASTEPFVTWLASQSSAGAVTAASDLIYISQSSASKKITPNALIFGRANTFTAQNTFAAGTITTSQPTTFTQTWNASGVTFTGHLINVTNTASAAASRVFDAQVGGSSVFYVRKDGVLGTDTAFSAGMMLNSATSFALFGRASYLPSTSIVAIGDDGGGYPGVRLGNAQYFSWSKQSGSTDSPDLSISRSAAGIMALRGSTTTTAAAVNFYTYGASPPAAPAASTGVLYTDTSGGKIRLMVRFPTGAAQQIAIEP